MMANPLELIKSIKIAAENINSNEKLAVPLLASKAFKGANEHPNDQTLRLMANVLGKMAKNGKVFITRNEFRKIYSQYSYNENRAIKIFANELDITDVDTERGIAGKGLEEPTDVYECADAKLSNSLANLWDEQGNPAKFGKINSHDPKFEKQAETLSSLELSRIGYSPKSVKTVGGSSEYIICDATYETPKGEAHVLVPVEISKSGTIIPSMIISKLGMFSLNRDSLKNSILSSAGKSLLIDTNVVLRSLASLEQVKDYSEFELKALAAQELVNSKHITKEASNNNENIRIDGPSTVGQFDLSSDEGGEIKIAKSKDAELFANYLDSGNGLAEFTFGKEIVSKGRDIIVSKMRSFGYTPQVSASSVCDNSIIYAVACDSRNGSVGFEVVVDIKNNKPIIPSILAVGDIPFEFTKEGIDKVISNQFSDTKMVAIVSPHYGLKPSELINIISKAADERNYRVAEDALVVLSETAGEETYSKGLAEYMRSLEKGNINKSASSKCRCNKVVKSPTHQEPMCGHLNLPLSKVAQDEKGRCVPKYRESMKDTYEGMLFNTSKVFM